MDYTGLNFSPPTPQEPSASGIMQRYAPSRVRGTGASGADASMFVPQDDRLSQTALQDDSTGDVARFLLQEIPDAQNQVVRALHDNDPETVRDILDRVDGFVQDHRSEISDWGVFNAAGPEGKAIARSAQSLLTHAYKDEWGVKGQGDSWFTAKMAYEDLGPEAVDRRVRKLVGEYGISEGAARAMSDVGQVDHAIFSSYASALSGLERAQKSGVDPLELKNRRNVLVANIKAADAFVQGAMADFGDGELLGSFVSEFDRTFNAKESVAGVEFMRDIAQGFLATDRRDVTGYMASVAAARDMVAAGLAQTSDADTMKRARTVEANTLVGEFIRETARLGQVAPLDSSRYSVALAEAAKKAAVMSDVYGIDLRDGSTGFSRRVAQMALRSLMVPGADDGGVSDFIDTLMPVLDRYCGSGGPLVPVKDANGRQSMQPVDGSFGPLESAIRVAAGRELWSLWRESGGGIGGAGEMLERLASDSAWQERLRGAVRGAVRARFMDGDIADRVADRVYMNPISDHPETVAHALNDLQGVYRPDGSVNIPSRVLIEANFDQSGKPVAAPTQNTVDLVLGAPEEVVPAASGSPELKAAMTDWAKWTKKAGADSKTGSDVYHRAEAAGRLVMEAALTDDDSDVVGASLAARAITIAGGGDLRKVVTSSTKARADLMMIARGVSESDPDALLAASVILRRFSESDILNHARVYGGPMAGGGRSQANILVDVLNAVKSTGLFDLSAGRDTVAQAIQILGARKQLEGTALVRSGYLDPETGQVSENNVIRKLQRDSFSNPAVMSNPKNNPEADDVALRANRVATTFLGEQTAVGREMRRYQAKLASLGYTKEEINTATGEMAEAAGAAFRRDGARGVALVGEKFMSKRQWFFPKLMKTPNGKGVLTADVVDPVAHMMTDDEGRDEQQRLIERYAQVLPGYTRQMLQTLFDQAQSFGKVRWAEQKAIQRKQSEAFAQGLGRKSGAMQADPSAE